MNAPTIDIATPVTRWGGERTLKHYWDLGPAPTDPHDGPGTMEAVLVVTHDKDRKQFRASLYQIAAYNTGTGFTVEKSAPLDRDTGFLTLLAKPVGRYSVKALTEFAAEAIDLLAGHLSDGTESVTARFENTTITQERD